MIASCWDWNSLKYSYFLMDNIPFDAGGWSPSKGIVSKDNSTNSNSVKCLDDCLPSLPEKSYFVGSGDFLIGELYCKKDSVTRPTLNLDKMYESGKPAEKKVVELIRDAQQCSTTQISNQNKLRENSPAQTQAELANIYKPTPTVWERLLPLITGAGIGYTVYSFSKGSLKLKDVMLVWTAGLAVGLSIGEETARIQLVKK
jgi:hypothetical protein